MSFALPSKYGAPGGSRRDTIDDDAEEAYEKAIAPIRAFMADVVKAANDYHRTGRAAAADCALAHLVAWAKADALKQPESHTSWYKLATTIAGLSSALMQIEPATRQSPDRALAVRWLAERGGQVRGYFDRLNTPRSSKNNHRAWAGLAVASVGVLAGDRTMLDWGLASYKLVICQATPEGALPLEIERGSKAREYHLYTLAALAPLAEIGARNGRASHGECGDALHRVARYTMNALRDPADIEKRAGATQAGGSKPPSGSKLVFLEPYLSRFPEHAAMAVPWLKQRPFGLTDLGGNQTLLYGK
jgi:poly(beta-D-mannuronate) lyase